MQLMLSKILRDVSTYVGNATSYHPVDNLLNFSHQATCDIRTVSAEDFSPSAGPRNDAR